MTSLWEIDDIQRYPKLKENLQADAVIVGAGLAGVWSAYLLSKKGKKVILIDQDRVGHKITLYTTAFITQVVDTSLVELREIFGEKAARLVWEAGRRAIDRIEAAVHEEKIDCEFEKQSLFVYARDKNEFESLKEEERLAKKLGFDVRLHERPRLGFENAGALEIRTQAKYHPIKFLKALLEACERQGVEIYERTEAEKIIGKGPLKVVTTDGNFIKSKDVIITTYKPFNNPKSVHFKKGMYVSYVYELRIKKGDLPQGMYQDLSNPYHYVRIDPLNQKYERMLVGGEDHRAELKIPSKKNFTALTEYIQETFPKLKYEIASKWSGDILEPSDGLALIGLAAPHQYIASAFSGNGMTYSALSGELLTDLLIGKKNKFAAAFDPLRPMKAKALYEKAKDYAGEFFGGAAKNIFK